MRYMLVWFTLFVTLHAVSVETLSGNWSAYRESMTDGTVTTEQEYLHLNADHTFSIQLFVNLQKGDAFIKGLRIEGSGIWKSKENTLVIYIQKVEVPFAKEIYLISQESLRQLANNFKAKYENEPLRIIEIKSFTSNQLVTLSERDIKTTYTRQ